MAKKKKDTAKAFSIQGFDAAHYRRTEAYTTAIENLYAKATTEISNAVASGTYDPDKPFAFSDYPRIASYVKQVMSKLAANVQAVISEGSRREWLFACRKNDEFIKSIMDTAKLTEKRLEKMQDRNLDALKSFQTRKVEGLDLSARVWKYTDQYKEQLELGLDVGLGEGRSAQQLARDVKQNLKDPNRLFRRVRDKRGNLHLSKAAKAFHPGTGVYRSSVKNAQRLTRSEINMAYRESDYLRWQQLDFVVGFDVHRSNHEPLCKCDLCAQLTGRYPKTFKFKGWHPQCMCYATPVLMDDDTFDANELGDLKAALRGTSYRHLEAKNAVTDVPDNFKEWVESHKEQQQGWKSVPYFIRDNFVNGNLADGLKESLTDGIVKTIMQAVEQVKSLGIANVDFGNCTVEQANMILEALHEEYDFFGKGGIPLDGISFTHGTKGTGGSYSPKNNTITIDPDIFNDKADSGKDISEKIAALETQKAKLQADIDKWTAKLASASPAAAKMLKQDIKYMKSRVSDIEIKIQKYQKDISAGHDKIALTYGNSLTDLKDRVKATIHHEFGHLFDHRYNGGEGYSGKAYNSTYAKTTAGEKFAEWYSQYMMGDKDGIPQELIDAFENRKPVDMFKPLLQEIMPQVEQARALCKEWGLTAASGAIESGIAQKNIEQVKAGIAQATGEALAFEKELNAWLKQIQPLLPAAKSYGINVDTFAGYVAEATGNHAKWAANRAQWQQAVKDLENAIGEAKDNVKLSSLLVDVADAKAKYGSEAVHKVYDAVEKKLADISSIDGSLEYMKKKLEFEINWVSTYKKYSTWEVAAQAYQKKLKEVNYQLDKKAIEQKAQPAITYLLASKSLKGKALCKKFQNLITTNTDIPVLQTTLGELNAEYQEQMAKDNAEKAKAALSRFAVNEFKGKMDWSDTTMYDQKRRDSAMWATEPSRADIELRGVCMKTWAKMSNQEKHDAWDYTEGSSFINEPLRKLYYSGRKGDRGVEAGERLAKVIDRSAYNFDMWLVRGVSVKAFEALFSISTSYIMNMAMRKTGRTEDISDEINSIARTVLLGKKGTEHAFSSCGNARGSGFSSSPVVYNIYCPKGTKMLYMEPFSYFGHGVNGNPADEMNAADGVKWDGVSPQSGFGHEAECLLQKETTFRITKVEYTGSSPYDGKWFIDLYVVNQ